MRSNKTRNLNLVPSIHRCLFKSSVVTSGRRSGARAPPVNFEATNTMPSSIFLSSYVAGRENLFAERCVRSPRPRSWTKTTSGSATGAGGRFALASS